MRPREISPKIVPELGRLRRSTCFAGFHRSDRTKAFGHWKYTRSTCTTITDRGSFPCAGNRSSSVGSMEISARPFTLRVSPTPGIRNSRAMRGSAIRLLRLSARLLPRRSGISSVRSSCTTTNPAGSPRGETSSPSGPLVAITMNGEASIIAR